MEIERVAIICHEVNRVYCESIGDVSQVPWSSAPLWQRVSALAGVQWRIENPQAPPSAQHEKWSADKVADGWVYGPIKDAVAKTHPCLVPYDALSHEQRAKDAFFQAVVDSCLLAPPYRFDIHPLAALAARVHAANAKWWVDLESGASLSRNVGELLMLVVSELSEALEGHRKNLPDDKLTHRAMFEVELADAIIRILDICGGMGLDLAGAFEEKLTFNANRADHTLEHRRQVNGKKY